MMQSQSRTLMNVVTTTNITGKTLSLVDALEVFMIVSLLSEREAHKT